MGAKRNVLSIDSHVVNILPPANEGATVQSQPFHLKNAAGASIILQQGVANATGVKLYACSDNQKTNPVAIGFDVFKQEVAGTANDVLGDRVTVDANGFVPTGADNTFYVLEIDSDQLPQGSPYLYLEVAGAAGYESAVAVLTGLRYSGGSNPAATN